MSGIRRWRGGAGVLDDAHPIQPGCQRRKREARYISASHDEGHVVAHHLVRTGIGRCCEARATTVYCRATTDQS